MVKLATLALKTACKPIASRLKKEAGYHPKFRSFIIAIAQVPLLFLPLARVLFPFSHSHVRYSVPCVTLVLPWIRPITD